MVDAYDGAGGRPTLQAVGPNGEDGIWRPVLTTLRRRFEFLRSMVRRNSEGCRAWQASRSFASARRWHARSRRRQEPRWPRMPARKVKKVRNPREALIRPGLQAWPETARVFRKPPETFVGTCRPVTNVSATNISPPAPYTIRLVLLPRERSRSRRDSQATRRAVAA